MKARINNRHDDIYRMIKQYEYSCQDINELYFYKNMYNAMEKISILYENGYDALKVYEDIVKDVPVSEAAQEVMELTALETNLLSLLIGLNRESLQEANSNIADRSLFQYLNYQSAVKVLIGNGMSLSGYEYSKMLAKHYKFNPKEEGPFPYMLSITKTDSRTRPYDYVTKIRNSFQHAEYFQPKGDINTIHITNHDDNGDLSFEGDLLLWSYRNFVEDFYGLGLGVSNLFELYDIPPKKTITDRKDLEDFIRNIVCTEIRFKKVPDKYKFSGQSALFSKLNECFGIDSVQKRDVIEVLDELEKEGLEYEMSSKAVNSEYTNKIIEYLESVYSSDFMYDNEEFVKYASSTVKLVHNPNHDIANSISNILRYISMKKNYLVMGYKPDTALFNEQIYDQHLKLSFKYALMLIKANIVNYCIECDKFDRPDLSNIDVLGLTISPQKEYVLRVIDEYEKCNDFDSSTKYVTINTIRNALAHGANRLTITTGKEKEIVLSDTFDKNHELHVFGGLDAYNKIFSDSCFKPDNIKIKSVDKSKVKKK